MIRLMESVNIYLAYTKKLKHMKKLTYIQINKYRAKYNDVLRKGLETLGIAYEQRSAKYGYSIFVNESDLSRAQRFLLSVSLTNPKYIS